MIGATAVLAGVVAVCIGLPGAGVARDLVVAVADSPAAVWAELRVPGALIVRSLATAAGIGVLATALAWGAARVLAGRGGRWWAPVVAAPMLLPMYLAYSAWGQLRAPGTWLGNWLAGVADGGHRWAPVLAGKALAVGGLALWGAPIAAVVLAVGMARRDRSLDEARRLEGGGVLARASHAMGAHRGAIACAIGAVAVVMLGSAVPMHLAQLETAAIVAWRRLGESGPDEWWRAWAGSWVSLGIAVIVGWIVGGRLVRAAADVRPTGAPEVTHATPARRWGAAALGVWALGVGVPFGLFVWAAGSWARVGEFFVLEGDALRASLGTACLLGAIVGTLAACTAAAVSAGDRRLNAAVSLSARLALIAGLAPGVLIGAAVARSALDGYPALVAAHVARFAFVGIGIGCWAAAGEPPERRALRRLDGRASLRAWAAACLPGQWGAIAGAAVAAGALSLHEIEASVIVQPAGVDSLAQGVLGMLHYARTRELAAAGIVVISIGIALSIAAVGLMAIGRDRGPTPRGGKPHDGGRGTG